MTRPTRTKNGECSRLLECARWRAQMERVFVQAGSPDLCLFASMCHTSPISRLSRLNTLCRYLGTSDDDKCRSVEMTQTLEFQCRFACFANNCNAPLPIRPTRESLYQPLGAGWAAFYAAYPDVAPANVATFKCNQCDPAAPPEICETYAPETATKCPDGWLPFCFTALQNNADGSKNVYRGWSCTHPGPEPYLQP